MHFNALTYKENLAAEEKSSPERATTEMRLKASVTMEFRMGVVAQIRDVHFVEAASGF